MQDAPNLTRLGDVLIDLGTVLAVTPIWFSNGQKIYGYKVVTSGGTLEVTDAKSVDAIRQQFYESPNP